MENKKYKFIVFEGIDGSGKSTVSRYLAREIHAKLYTTPPPGFKSTRRKFDSFVKLPSRFLFYLSSVAYASEEIKKLLQKRHVVCDRYIASTLAYHKALGVKLNWDLEQLNLVKPDFTFFLEINNEQERVRRLKERNFYTSTDALLNDNEIREKLMNEYRKFPMISIDTSLLSAEEVVNTIRNKVNL